MVYHFSLRNWKVRSWFDNSLNSRVIHKKILQCILVTYLNNQKCFSNIETFVNNILPVDPGLKWNLHRLIFCTFRNLHGFFLPDSTHTFHSYFCRSEACFSNNLYFFLLPEQTWKEEYRSYVKKITITMLCILKWKNWVILSIWDC